MSYIVNFNLVIINYFCYFVILIYRVMSNIKVIDYLKKKINENIRTREEIEQILQNIKEKNKNNDISKLDSDSAHIYNKILDEIF